jgi:hypothetical protein
MAAPPPFTVVALVPDMLTSVRVESAVQRVGGELRVVQTETELVTTLRDTTASLAIVDLGLTWLDLSFVVEACQKLKVPLIAFGPHVDAARLRAARNAGVDYVYPRSQFLADLPGVLATALPATGATSAAL